MQGTIDTTLLVSDGRRPLYVQVRDDLRDAITQGKLSADEALPGEREIADKLGVSRVTVRKAIQGLEDESLVERRQGAGTFVASRIEKDFSALSSFTEDMQSRGWRAHSEWLGKSEITMSPDDTLIHGFAPGESLLCFERIRFAQGMPLALETSLVPAWCLPSLDAVDDSLYAALAASGERPVKGLQRLQAVAFDEDQAAILNIETGSPGLFITRRGYDASGRQIESTMSWYRGDMYDFVSALTF